MQFGWSSRLFVGAGQQSELPLGGLRSKTLEPRKMTPETRNSRCRNLHIMCALSYILDLYGRSEGPKITIHLHPTLPSICSLTSQPPQETVWSIGYTSLVSSHSTGQSNHFAVYCHTTQYISLFCQQQTWQHPHKTETCFVVTAGAVKHLSHKMLLLRA